MKLQRHIGTMLAAAVLLSVSASQAFAQSRTVFFPYYPYVTYPSGPHGLNPLVQPNTTSWTTWESYNPYVAPYPSYGILPPPFLTAQGGYTSQNGGYGTRRTAEDFGYSRGDITTNPAKRNAMYPAVPFQGRPEEESIADARRARFYITVPDADAVVYFDGVKTRQAGTEREYVTPPLDANRDYTSTIEVRFLGENGKERTRTKTFDINAGKTVRHTFIE